MNVFESRRRGSARICFLAVICALLALLGGAVASARADRPLLTRELFPGGNLDEKVPGRQIEGACGIAFAGETMYVSDYYRHFVLAFESTGAFQSLIPTDPLDGACGLATSAGGDLYANDWHEGAEELAPAAFALDSRESTGVAVDQATGDLYVDDRTFVAVYAAPIVAGAQPVAIVGSGTLGDGYGVAVESGRVSVADASDGTVKVYEPSASLVDPVQVIDGSETPQGGFASLVDSALTTDPANQHLLVLDNLQPGFESPEAVVDEFDSTGAFLGQLKAHLVDGEPSGLAVHDGDLYVTTGNTEFSNVAKFGPYAEAPPAAPSLAAPTGAVGAIAATRDQPSLQVSNPDTREAGPALRRAKAECSRKPSGPGRRPCRRKAKKRRGHGR
jgi:hypothetical protein